MYRAEPYQLWPVLPLTRLRFLLFSLLTAGFSKLGTNFLVVFLLVPTFHPKQGVPIFPRFFILPFSAEHRLPCFLFLPSTVREPRTRCPTRCPSTASRAGLRPFGDRGGWGGVGGGGGWVGVAGGGGWGGWVGAACGEKGARKKKKQEHGEMVVLRPTPFRPGLDGEVGRCLSTLRRRGSNSCL